MLNLPDRTLYNRRIPKSKFYEKLSVSAKLKNKFIDEVDHIIWKHKLSKETVNLEPAQEVQEIQIFEIYLKQRKLSREILENIDKSIPYPILHLLVYKEEVRLVMAYKKRSQKDQGKYVVKAYYESNWQTIKDVTINLLNGLDLGAVYENIIKYLMPGPVPAGENIDAAVQRHSAYDKLQRECEALELKINKEKQFNHKVELNIELQRKKQELNRLKVGLQEEKNE